MEHLVYDQGRSDKHRKRYRQLRDNEKTPDSLQIQPDMIIVPDGRKPHEYLEEMFPGRVGKDHCDWLYTVWNHPLVRFDQGGDVTEFMLSVQAYGNIYVDGQSAEYLKGQLTELGHDTKGNNSGYGLNVYFNGLVLQYLPGSCYFLASIDPKRANKVLRCRTLGTGKTRKPPMRIMLNDFNAYGCWIMVYLWNKMLIPDLLSATMSRKGYQSFQSASRWKALGAIEALHKVCRKNRIRMWPGMRVRDQGWRNGKLYLEPKWRKEMQRKIKLIIPKLKAKIVKTPVDDAHKPMLNEMILEIKVLRQMNNILKGKGYA